MKLSASVTAPTPGSPLSCVTSSPGGITVTAGGSVTQVTVSGLTNGTPYTFAVFATNALGNSSTALSSNTATPEPTLAPIDVGPRGLLLGRHRRAPSTMTLARGQPMPTVRNTPGYSARPPTPTLALLACNGATTTDMERDQLPLVPVNTDNILLTIGGNDLGFSTVLGDCIKPTSDCNRDFPNKESEITAFQGRLAQVYREVRSAAPRARIEVLTYPHILTNTGRVSRCVGDFGIVPAEKDWVNARTTQQLRSTDSTPGGVYAAAAFVGSAGAILAIGAIIFGVRTWRRARLGYVDKAPMASYAVAIGAIGFMTSGGVALIAILLNAAFGGTDF